MGSSREHSSGARSPRDTSTNEETGQSKATIRRALPPDAPFVHAILKESPEASMWSLESVRQSISQGIAWAAELNGQVTGILIGRVIADEFEILNLAVAKASRRRGTATQLLRSALQSAKSSDVIRIFLEVRAANEPAIALYSRFGFRICGRRANYYRDPIEDAVLLVLHSNEIIL